MTVLDDAVANLERLAENYGGGAFRDKADGARTELAQLRAERVAIVSWLRAEASTWGQSVSGGIALTDAADAIERGEHTKGAS